MKKLSFIFLAGLLSLTACQSPTTTTKETVTEAGPPEDEVEEAPKTSSMHMAMSMVNPSDPVVYSFAFTGCNRVDRGDIRNQKITDGSSANTAALKAIFNDMTALPRKPNMFFFLGDLVVGQRQNDTAFLASELTDWVKLYNDKSFSSISTSGIPMIALPGNHEMLQAVNLADPGNPADWHEFPLNGATDVWMRYMLPYMPADRIAVNGADSLDNRMTFAFSRNGIGFIVMNTDTYNAPVSPAKYGSEGLVNWSWVINQIKTFKADPAIKYIFVLGHKPYYVGNSLAGSHDGIAKNASYWNALTAEGMVAMLSAHKHDFYFSQPPNNKGAYQVIAGHAGSSDPQFMGYTIINILKSGKVEMVNRSYKRGNKYYDVPQHVVFNAQSQELTWK